MVCWKRSSSSALHPPYYPTMTNTLLAGARHYRDRCWVGVVPRTLAGARHGRHHVVPGTRLTAVPDQNLKRVPCTAGA